MADRFSGRFTVPSKLLSLSPYIVYFTIFPRLLEFMLIQHGLTCWLFNVVVAPFPHNDPCNELSKIQTRIKPSKHFEFSKIYPINFEHNCQFKQEQLCQTFCYAQAVLRILRRSLGRCFSSKVLRTRTKEDFPASV